jgi:hypothetical protein
LDKFQVEDLCIEKGVAIGYLDETGIYNANGVRVNGRLVIQE